MSKNRFLIAMIPALATMAPAAYAEDKIQVVGTLTQATHVEDKDAGVKPDPDKKVCKSERMTGSLTRAIRTCKTQAEWSQVAEATNKSIEDLNRNQSRWIPDNSGKTPGLGF